MTSPIATRLAQAIVAHRPEHVSLNDYSKAFGEVRLVSERVDIHNGYIGSGFYVVEAEEIWDSWESHYDGSREEACLYVGFLWREVSFRGYKIDFLLRFDDTWLAVECDGHDYHNATKQQVAYDRARDREFQLAGLPIFRFTGSEIHHSDERCAREIWTMADRLHASWQHVADLNKKHADDATKATR